MSDRIECQIKAPVHFWLRNAADFVRTANKFKSDIALLYEGHKVNGKSMINLMEFPIQRGRVFQIQVKGLDAEPCLKALEASVRSMKELVVEESPLTD